MTVLLGALLSKHWKLVAAGAVVIGLFVAWQADRRGQYRAGQQAERTAAIERAKELIEKRSKDDAEIRMLDDAGWCREFGYRWVPDQGCVD